ncbi:hypothetical protein H0H87_010636 [Tephrocybe sp. NHM501043]|nr:hypothetical protein H0H87_010636 [Tephrocybe sp. NHM501043]
MERNSTRAGIGEQSHPSSPSCSSNSSRASIHSGAPFETEIGVGKVIKGWDEGVPQLSVGQKAVLTATPDYVHLHAHSTIIMLSFDIFVTGLRCSRIPPGDTAKLDSQVRG